MLCHHRRLGRQGVKPKRGCEGAVPREVGQITFGLSLTEDLLDLFGGWAPGACGEVGLLIGLGCSIRVAWSLLPWLYGCVWGGSRRLSHFSLTRTELLETNDPRRKVVSCKKLWKGTAAAREGPPARMAWTIGHQTLEIRHGSGGVALSSLHLDSTPPGRMAGQRGFLLGLRRVITAGG